MNKYYDRGNLYNFWGGNIKKVLNIRKSNLVEANKIRELSSLYLRSEGVLFSEEEVAVQVAVRELAGVKRWKSWCKDLRGRLFQAKNAAHLMLCTALSRSLLLPLSFLCQVLPIKQYQFSIRNAEGNLGISYILLLFIKTSRKYQLRIQFLQANALHQNVNDKV